MNDWDSLSDKSGYRGVAIRCFFSAALAFANAAFAQPANPGPQAPQRYAVSHVVVAEGGVSVRETEDGVLYAPILNESCLSADEPSTSPLAGTLSTSISLEVSVVACGQAAEAPEPEVTCDWTLQPTSLGDYQSSLVGFTGAQSCGEPRGSTFSGSQSWKGFSGRVDLSVPDEVAIHELTLSCMIQGETSNPTLKTSLFSVYSEPLTVVSPPKASWFALSACWGSGLRSGDSENDVLKALVQGIHSYGQQLWHYGYAEETSLGLFSFPMFESDAGISSILYNIKDEELRPGCSESGKCKCRWQGLVEPGALCNFSDCYGLSDVLQAMAAVMGVGGLRYRAVRGRAGIGFLSQAGSSMDPRFTQTVNCVKGRTECFPYYFGNHSLRLRDGIYYDSTFRRFYSSPDEAVALDQKYLDSDLLGFFDSDLLLSPALGVYGKWSYHRETSLHEPAPSLAYRDMADGVRVTDVTFDTKDKDDTKDKNSGTGTGGLHEQLVARLEVEILVGGSYLIHGSLSRDGKRVTDQPDWWTTQPTVGTVSGHAGEETTLSLYFSGQEIYQSHVDGPYDFNVGTSSFVTPAFKSDSFGELDAAIREGSVEIAGRGVKITVPFRVWKEGRYTLEARLARDNTTIGYAGKQEDFEPGEYEVDLNIHGGEIAISELDGPYELTLVYYDNHQAAKTSIQQTIEVFSASAAGGSEPPRASSNR